MVSQEIVLVIKTFASDFGLVFFLKKDSSPKNEKS